MKRTVRHISMKWMLFGILVSLFTGNIYGQQSGSAISTDGAKIYYKTFGKGQPLLIINGGPGMNSDGFEGLAVSLSQYFMTIIYDQRGTGKSELKVLDSTTITMELMLHDIESIRKQMKLASWSVLGHSFGGMVASAYATVYPDVIDNIVLSSSGGINLKLLDYFRESLHSKLTPTQLDSVNYWERKIAAGETDHYTRLQRGKYLAAAYVMDPQYYPVIAERLTQGNGTINQLMWDDLRKQKFDCAPKLKSFMSPVLIIQGKQDIVRASTAEEAHKAFPNSRIVYMDHCIHYGWLDNPEVYFREVVRFLL
jgi:proline iminopeptidase